MSYYKKRHNFKAIKITLIAGLHKFIHLFNKYLLSTYLRQETLRC